MSKSIVIAAGGTGGHLYPAIAVAEEVRRAHPEIRIVFIGTPQRIEAREVPRAGFEFFPIDIQAPGKSLGSLLQFPLRYLRASRQSRNILREIKPCAFLGGGAYLSVPAAFAAKSQAIPIALLEINAIPGKANTMLAGVAEKVFAAYTESVHGFRSTQKRKIEVIGTPVRYSVAAGEQSPEGARTHFGLDPQKKTLLVFGGSLGARSINEAMSLAINTFVERGYNIIWQTGSSTDVEKLQQQFEVSGRVKVLAYISEMDKAYAASDLVVSRAGASTLAELATLGKPAILVPYPFAAKNHQEHNARSFEQGGAAEVILDGQLNEMLAQRVIALLENDSIRAHMAKQMGERENKDATKVVAQWLVARCKA